MGFAKKLPSFPREKDRLKDPITSYSPSKFELIGTCFSCQAIVDRCRCLLARHSPIDVRFWGLDQSSGDPVKLEKIEQEILQKAIFQEKNIQKEI